MTMRMTRRGAMAALVVAGSASAISVGQRAFASAPDLAIFDSRILESRAFATQMQGRGAHLFDVADQDQSLWREARSGFGLTARSSVAGMTRWSDWVAISSLLAERGYRTNAHEKMRGVSHTGLFTWEMI
jgi:hypothetical protein